jgi:hypothetical protein|tara:strand:+ start:507 stop:656 length:150 start_codon:yes stop_codon:yes gene_type:complete
MQTFNKNRYYRSFRTYEINSTFGKKYDFSFNEYSKKNNNFKVKNLEKYI